MKLTILQVGETPAALRDERPRFQPFFETMFDSTGHDFTYEQVLIIDGEPFPDPGAIEGAVVTGSFYGVYDDVAWMEPLRAFIRDAYARKTPMLGVCFGHQIMADALGGEVRKSEKGWGIGRHVYERSAKNDLLASLPGEVALAASHQDQVITPPGEAEVFLSSDFTPNAGLVYANGAAISMQPHPEFDVGFSKALVELRRNNPLSDTIVEERLSTLDKPVDNTKVATMLGQFLLAAKKI